MDSPDGWAQGWVLEGEEAPSRMKRQQGGGGVMVWAGIVHQTIIGPFKVDEGVKLNSESLCAFLEKTYFRWYKGQNRGFKTKSVLSCTTMHYRMLHVSLRSFWRANEFQERGLWNGHPQV